MRMFQSISTSARVTALASLFALAACAVPGSEEPAVDREAEHVGQVEQGEQIEHEQESSMLRTKGDGKTAMERALARLHTHAEIKARLKKIQLRSRVPMAYGPLIKNGLNGGLIDIDVPVSENLDVHYNVCGGGRRTTIRWAVTCTVRQGERGNRDPYKVGYSTQGRELLAVRLGVPTGERVVFWTQQHGNEILSTEAALDVIEELTSKNLANRNTPEWIREALTKLDILIVVRANPDGGEVGPNCFLPPYAVGSVVGKSTCGLTRYNVDPEAGGGFKGDSEPDFSGVVGRGYDMNRYHHADLRGAIRPVEVQALVASVLAFQPKRLLDLHGDIGKGACTVDMTSLTPNPVLGGLPNAKCVEHSHDGSSYPEEQLVDFSMIGGHSPDGSLAQRQRRTLGANLVKAVEQNKLGRGARFTQIAVGAGLIADAEPYAAIGIEQAGWESRTMSKIGLSVLGVKGGVPQVGFGPDVGFDAEYLDRGIQINKVALREALATLAGFVRKAPTNDGNYCSIPVATGIVNTLPEFFFGPNPYASSPAHVPLLPGVVPFKYFDDCQ